ncbi:MAG: hypothetical protein IJ741_07045 [Schwartzia sp.]|nr:hypothetical protein [Schwartzia sp. (in: firmicutes)]
MLEIKVTVDAPALAAAIDKLAQAMGGSIKIPAAVSVPPLVDVPKWETPAPVQPAAPQTSPAAPASPVANVPLAQAPQYTAEQIMAAGATLMDAGKVNELIALLHSFGVQAVMDLKPEQLGAFATKMRELGAKI